MIVLALEDSLRADLTPHLKTEAFTQEEHRKIYARQAVFFTVISEPTFSLQRIWNHWMRITLG